MNLVRIEDRIINLDNMTYCVANGGQLWVHFLASEPIGIQKWQAKALWAFLEKSSKPVT